MTKGMKGEERREKAMDNGKEYFDVLNDFPKILLEVMISDLHLCVNTPLV